VKYFKVHQRGFALIEVLVAVAIASIVVLSIYAGVSSGTMAVSQNAKLTRAIIIAKSKLNEFRASGMSGTDLSHEEVKEYPDFRLSRESKRYENPLFGPFPAKITTITVEWEERGHPKNYSLFTITME
jgi:prepilin-type N-terminal cleavage/methylation domain-containing protein